MGAGGEGESEDVASVAAEENSFLPVADRPTSLYRAVRFCRRSGWRGRREVGRSLELGSGRPWVSTLYGVEGKAGRGRGTLLLWTRSLGRVQEFNSSRLQESGEEPRCASSKREVNSSLKDRDAKCFNGFRKFCSEVQGKSIVTPLSLPSCTPQHRSSLTLSKTTAAPLLPGNLRSSSSFLLSFSALPCVACSCY